MKVLFKTLMYKPRDENPIFPIQKLFFPHQCFWTLLFIRKEKSCKQNALTRPLPPTTVWGAAAAAAAAGRGVPLCSLAAMVDGGESRIPQPLRQSGAVRIERMGRWMKDRWLCGRGANGQLRCDEASPPPLPPHILPPTRRYFLRSLPCVIHRTTSIWWYASFANPPLPRACLVVVKSSSSLLPLLFLCYSWIIDRCVRAFSCAASSCACWVSQFRWRHEFHGEGSGIALVGEAPGFPPAGFMEGSRREDYS